jgi:hypothetical protein
MTVNIPIGVIEIQLEMIELKLDRLIDEMRFLKSRTIAFDTRLRERISNRANRANNSPKANPRRGWRTAASATARTGLFGVGAAVGAAVTKLYLGT